MSSSLLFIGVDLNTTGHIVVVSDPSTGKVYKMGKQVRHIFYKYRHLRKHLENDGHYKLARHVGQHRRDNIMNNILHHISKKIVQIAQSSNAAGFRLEDLAAVHERKKWRAGRATIFSFARKFFYLLHEMIQKKAEKAGLTIEYVRPDFTSKMCSRCASSGKRVGKKRFRCQRCGHLDHADANSAFNIAQAVCYCNLGHTRKNLSASYGREQSMIDPAKTGYDLQEGSL